MKSFRKFLESYKSINEAEYNKEWWDSKSDSFKKRYIERHPNSIYANVGMKGKDVSYDKFKNRNKLSKDEKKAAWDREQKKHNDNLSKIKKQSDNKNTLKSKKDDIVPDGYKIKKRDIFWDLNHEYGPSINSTIKKSMTKNDYETLRKTANDSDDREEVDDLFVRSRYATPEFLHNYIKKSLDVLSKRDNWSNSGFLKGDQIDSEISGDVMKIAKAFNNPNLSKDDREKIEALIEKAKTQKIKKWPHGGKIEAGDVLTSAINNKINSLGPKTQNKDTFNIKDFIVKDGEKETKISTKNIKSISDIKKMTDKEREKLYNQVLDNPGKYWVNQYVNPDGDVPDGVLVDNDGMVIGFTDEKTAKQYGKKPTEDDIRINKLVMDYLSQDE